VTEGAVLGLSKKQKKGRKDSKLGLRNVVEEMESDYNMVGASLYDALHGAEQRGGEWWTTERRAEAGGPELPDGVQRAKHQCKLELESPSKFAVDQVWEQEGGQYRQVNTGYVEDMMGQDCVIAQSYEDICVRQMYPGTVPGQTKHAVYGNNFLFCRCPHYVWWCYCRKDVSTCTKETGLTCRCIQTQPVIHYLTILSVKVTQFLLHISMT
jgi:hypothetical protein